MKNRHARGFIDSATLRFDDSVFDLVAHADAVATTDFVCLVEQVNRTLKVFAVDCNRATLHKLNSDVFAVDAHRVIPEFNAHDWFNGFIRGVEVLENLGLVGCAEHIGIGAVSLLGRGTVWQLACEQPLRHLVATAELFDELRV